MTRKRRMTGTQIESTVPGLNCRMNNGAWTLFFAAGLTATGKRKALSLKTSDPQLAEKMLEKTEAELVGGRRSYRELSLVDRSTPRPTLTVRQAVALYLADAPARLGAESVALHRGMLTRWVLTSPISDQLIIDVKTKMIKDMLKTVRLTKNQFGRLNTRGTAIIALAAVRSLFEWLRSEELLVDRDGRLLPNPAAKLMSATRHAAHDDAVQERVKPFTREEQAALLKAAPAEWVRVFLLLGLRAGLRIGEILTLQFDDFDFERNNLRVSRRWTPSRGAMPGVKNRRNGRRLPFRDVPLDVSAELVDAVRAQIARRREQNAEMGWSDNSWLFVNRDGGVVHRTNFHGQTWAPLLKRAKIGPHVFHDTRHTFATELLMMTNGNLDVVARALGDRMDVTANVYCHVLEALKPRFPGVLDFAQAPTPDGGNVIQLDAARRRSS